MIILLTFVIYNWYRSRKHEEEIEEKLEDIEEKLKGKVEAKQPLKIRGHIKERVKRFNITEIKFVVTRLKIDIKNLESKFSKIRFNNLEKELREIFGRRINFPEIKPIKTKFKIIQRLKESKLPQMKIDNDLKKKLGKILKRGIKRIEYIGEVLKKSLEKETKKSRKKIKKVKKKFKKKSRKRIKKIRKRIEHPKERVRHLRIRIKHMRNKIKHGATERTKK